MSPVIERLNSFVQSRFRHSDTETLNVLNSCFSAWYRYYNFLQVIRARIQETANLFVERMKSSSRRCRKRNPASRPVTAEEWNEMQITGELTARLHLDIESFYVFANILLDRIASTIRYYYWKRANWNHMQVIDNLQKACATKRPPCLAAKPRVVKTLLNKK
jgi:hypothetical protein